MWRRPIPSDDCSRACEWISLRLDGQLSDFERMLLEAHLSRCPDCRAFAQSAAGLTGLLRAAPLEECTLSFEAPRRHGIRAHGLRAVSVAAAAAAVGLSGIVGLNLSTDHAPSASARVTREVIGLKERQLEQLDSAGRQSVPVARGLAAVEQLTPSIAPAKSPRGTKRIPANG